MKITLLASENTALPGRCGEKTAAIRRWASAALTSAVLLAGCSRGGPDSGGEPDAEPSGEYGAFASNAAVESVIDGDTIEVAMGSGSETVRLVGIDTPETVDPNRPEQCYGAEASDYLKRLLPAGTPVTLVLDIEARDSYGRLLAYVMRSGDEMFVNWEMVASGHAAAFSIEPNRFFEGALSAAETRARSTGLGLWGACGGPDVPLS